MKTCLQRLGESPAEPQAQRPGDAGTMEDHGRPWGHAQSEAIVVTQPTKVGEKYRLPEKLAFGVSV